MASYSLFYTTAFFLVFLTISHIASAQDPTFRYIHCPNTTTFTRNSTYFVNLRTLLSSLSSPNASYSFGFQNVTAGRSPDMVTGLFLCRGDLSHEACRDCVVFAANDTLGRCPEGKEATIWYDECMLRYSHRNILSSLSMEPRLLLLNPQNVAANELDRFTEVLFSTMNEAASEATNNSRKFAVKKTNFTSRTSIYGLVQCTPDLTRQECGSCLQQAVDQLPNRNIGGRVLFPSCNSRFDLYPFYNETAVETSPPAPSGPVPPRPPGKGQNSSVMIIAVVVPVVVLAVLFLVGYCLLAKRARRKSYNTAPADEAGDDITNDELFQIDFNTIKVATNSFSESNLLGQGGFGEVYKGTFPNGTEVAVKRLSKSSGQGAQEFKNEVILVAKLRHRNLASLHGFCLEGEEKILLYEFVPNKSLDYFLFDNTKQGQLNWTRRYKIIEGITRGMVYLHQDSQLTIIHRDLKASNILLDADMNPKISDFGMARIFGADQTLSNYTSKIVGTYGYMSPEYAMHGKFSLKSDVYSFGVLVLEIISGKKNSNFYQTDGVCDLVTYAWRVWRNGSPLELLDPTIVENYQRNEVIRCIHIGLLCVQEDPAHRPNMSTVSLMLTSATITLPVPQQPAFVFQSKQVSDPLANELESDQSSNKPAAYSTDEASITEIYPR